MRHRLEPKLDILPAAQKEIWSSLSPAPSLGFVLYGGTAIALHLGHRESLDFDFFRSEPRSSAASEKLRRSTTRVNTRIASNRSIVTIRISRTVLPNIA
ncbi:nucleotidyl transferase AbiEii/AbiGii toxin family protein [Bradyrhizobium cenepequi]